MASVEEDMRLGDLTGDMKDHTDRLAWAMPWTLILFALAAFASAIVWIIYAALAGNNVDDAVGIINKQGNPDLNDDEEDLIRNRLRYELAFQGAVVGFLIIISYATVYGALKIAHRK